MSAFSSLFNTTEFLLIGHRGAAGLETENTLPSFQRAIDHIDTTLLARYIPTQTDLY